MRRLLQLAQSTCGDSARQRVFEPLIADWQRELSSASPGPARARIVVSGCVAFTLTMVQCIMTGGVRMPRVAIKSAAILTLSTFALIAIQIVVIAIQRSDYAAAFPPEFLLRIAWATVLSLAVPLAMLPLMMSPRAMTGITRRQAAISEPRCGVVSLAVITVFILDGRLSYRVNGGIVEIGRAPAWLPLAIFASAAVAINAVCWQRQRSD